MQNLKKFDLNTLVALKVLLDEKHVTHAAAKLHLTQSAVSRILAKLRDQFDDPLLVKSGQHLARTAKAERLYAPLDQILTQVSCLIEPDIFTPETATGTIRIATTDYGSQTLLPKLVPLLEELAPGVNLTLVDWRSKVLTELEQNNVDLILGGARQPPPNIYQKILAKDEYVCVLRKGHSNQDSLSFDDYLALNHVMVSPSGKGSSEIDLILAKRDKQRKVAIRVPHFFTALDIIASTDYVMLLPKHFVRRYVDLDRFTILTVPFETPFFEVSMFWHARIHQDPLHLWFRDFVYQNIYKKRARTPLTR